MQARSQQPAQQPARARTFGIAPGSLPTGPLNAITDVSGVLVGHCTLVDPPTIHTGVTAVVPERLGVEHPSLPCGLFVGNGHGKLVGATQVGELGTMETPIVLTATLSAFRAADALVGHMLAQPGYEEVRSLNPLVGETNDGTLSDIRARPITVEHVLDAVRSAGPGLPAEGCVGAGTGTSALGYKAGIGTSSRRVEVNGTTVTLGVLVQANFSGCLRVLGIPMPAGELLEPSHVQPSHVQPSHDQPSHVQPSHVGNSCMIVLATDAPVDARQLSRLARRGVFAMARVGSDFAGGSGDYAIAFSTGESAAAVPDTELDALFAAALEGVEEAVLNSLFMARDTTGVDGHVRYAVPHARVRERLRRAGVR